MCRHLAYLGPTTRLAALLVDAPHGLVDQAQYPRFQTSGTSNPDGWGVAWYEPDDRHPRRHRSTTPIWDDPEVGTVAPVRTRMALAAARLASPGSPVEVSGNAPFVADRYAWSLNGVVEGWHDGVGADLRSRISPDRAAGIEGVSDGEALFALALDRLGAGASAPDALANVIGLVTARTGGRLNFLLTDGESIAATAWGNSLFIRPRDDSVVVASEPIDDDDGWTRVSDRTLVVADATSSRCVPL
jgi:glutamine amidotransferase